MASGIVVKCDPTEDLYLVWNRVADGPEFVGDRMALMQYLGSGRTEPTQNGEETIQERIRRADTTGTSCRPDPNPNVSVYPLDGSWEDSGFVYDQRGWLPRERLSDFARAILDNQDELVYLDPFDDDIYR